MDIGGSGEGPLVVTQYMLLFDNILHRMRFPKLLAIVSEELDKEVSYLRFRLKPHCLHALVGSFNTSFIICLAV